MVDLKGVKHRFRSLRRHLDERTRRLFAAAESEAIGRGGISAVSAAIGMSRRVVREGKRDLRARVTPPTGRLRQPGGGRKKMVVEDPSLLVDLERLVEPLTRGDRNLRCVGPARVCGNWRRNCSGRAIKRVTGWWLDCCMGWDTACRQIARLARAAATRTAMRSSNISMERSRVFSVVDNPWSRWTPKRRN